jgi:hypothetical protein
MNKFSLKAHLQSELESFASSFKATSYDDANQVHLCQDETTPEVYDFDAYVKTRCSRPTPASPDAIHIGNKDLYFVEFKNEAAAKVDGVQIRRKFEAGTRILQNLLQGFGAKDCQYHFCVVVKNQSRPRWMDFRHIEKSVVKFGLQELNQNLGSFYDHVVTESLDFYVKEFKALKCTETVTSPTNA